MTILEFISTFLLAAFIGGWVTTNGIAKAVTRRRFEWGGHSYILVKEDELARAGLKTPPRESKTATVDEVREAIDSGEFDGEIFRAMRRNEARRGQ